MRSILWKVIPLAGLLTGCLSVEPPEGRLVCTEASVAVDCPSGWSCVDGLCFRESGGRDGGPDASLADAGPVDGGSTDAGQGDGGQSDGGQADAGQDARVTCAAASECDDGDPCTVDACNAEGICEHVFTTNGTPDLPDESGNDENCDGVDGVATRDIYVAAGGTGVGTPSDPTDLESALAAFSSGVHVIVAAGDYPIGAPIVAPDGLQMHGGYGLDFRSRPGGTRVISSAPRALVMRGLTAATIERVDWQAADATGPGGHTQAITVVGSSGITLRSLTVTAGDGASGTSGAPGMDAAAPPPAQFNGGSANGTFGGAGALCATPNGGNGRGLGATNLAGADAPVVDLIGNCGRGGTPGGASRDHGACVANGSYVAPGTANGKPGEPGCPQLGVGSAGAGGAGPGTVDANGVWSGADGAVGGTGPAGNPGGGGGGGGSFEQVTCGSPVAAGGGAGCGGPGGLGGQGGGPGRAGGASIAIVSRDSTVLLDRVTLRTGAGGAGGRGADGGRGSAGRAGSTGGNGGLVSGPMSTSHRGAIGGSGGQGSAGGPGGCGGGGAGGSTIGVFHVGWGAVSVMGVTYELGTGGAPGPACEAAAGDPAQGQPGQPGMPRQVVSL